MAKDKSGKIEAQEGVFEQEAQQAPVQNDHLSGVENQEAQTPQARYLTYDQTLQISRIERQLFSKNDIKMRIKILEIIQGEKKPIIDKETGTQKLDKYTGELAYWPQKHYIHYSFEGGEDKQEISPSLASKIEKGENYIAIGIYAEVNTFTSAMGFKILDLIQFEDYARAYIEKHLFSKK